MPENLFSTSLAIWSAVAVGLLLLPPLIHLINMMRYRRVKWAAMEFLLQSQRRNKNRIWLKQLLLLLSRMAILLSLLFMLSHLGCQNSRLAGLLGNGSTHHYILLDDSLSMAAVDEQGVSSFERARKTAKLILQRTQNRSSQLVTLVRLTRADIANRRIAQGKPTTTKLDFNSVLIDNQQLRLIEERLDELAVSALVAEPGPAVNLANDLIRSRPSENAIVYLLSDFRERESGEASKLSESISRLDEVVDRIEMIRCESSSRENLAIRELRPTGYVRSVDVPIPMSLVIENKGQQSVRNFQVQLSQRSLTATDPKSIVEGTPEILPTIFVDDIKPGESQVRSFMANLNGAGEFAIRAELPPDSLALDNVRENVVKANPVSKVLLIEGPTGQPAAPFLELAMGAQAMTGLQLETRTVDFLRDGDEKSLQPYDVLFLTAISTLDDVVVKRLEHFVQTGGGLALFLGEETNPAFFRESLYRQGNGLFSVPIGAAIDVPLRGAEDPPDIKVTDHPLFSVFRNTKNSPLDLVQIKRLLVPDPNRPNDKDSESSDGQREAEVPCTLRGNANQPLIVLNSFGTGRTALVMTSAGPTWNNWARNPTFVVALMLLENELARGRYPFENHLVGQPWSISLDPKRHLKTVSIQTPEAGRIPGSSLTSDAAAEDAGGFQAAFEFDDDGQLITDQPGIYLANLRSLEGNAETRFVAFGVDSTESDLALATPQKLVAQFGKSAVVLSWDDFNPDPENPDVTPLTRVLLLFVCGLLVVEGFLAYANSYHLRTARGAA
jgi:hypothetical protein